MALANNVNRKMVGNLGLLKVGRAFHDVTDKGLKLARFRELTCYIFVGN